MSYSTLAKSELCAIRPMSECCNIAEAYGLLLCSKLLTEKHNSYSTDNKAIVGLVGQMAASVCGIFVDVMSYPKSDDRPANERFVIKIPDSVQKEMLLQRFSGSNSELLKNECCIASFLRGAFLVCGTVTDPAKDYHLEFLAGTESRCDILTDALKRLGIRTHKLSRGERWVVYVKDADGISVLMDKLGAKGAAAYLEQTREYRRNCNSANRVKNCDEANINRIVSASVEQCTAIKKLIKAKGKEGIPPELREIAQLRLENPDMSLRELSENLSEPISRSGVNHRLKKLVDLAKDI